MHLNLEDWEQCMLFESVLCVKIGEDTVMCISFASCAQKYNFITPVELKDWAGVEGGGSYTFGTVEGYTVNYLAAVNLFLAEKCLQAKNCSGSKELLLDYNIH